jgi:hydroxyacylglutathione hydrolase
MQIDAIPAFEDNYIWALRANGHAAVVDPGEAAPVLRFLEKTGDRLCAILVTHKHGDHVGGIAELVARHPVPVYGPTREAAEVVTHPLAADAHVVLDELGVTLEVMEVPGHTLGHVAFYSAGVLFCGDTLFGAGCGRVFEGTLAQMYASLARLAALPPDTRVYCAHEYTQSCLRFARTVEPANAAIDARSDKVAHQRAAGQPSVPSTLAEELATNPFLRWRAPAVVAAATARLGRPPVDDAETFGAIRVWRDSL